jgi:hypothetical protein
MPNRNDDVQELTLCPRRLKMALYAALCAAFTFIGALMIRDGVGAGWFVGGFFGLGTLIFVAVLMPGAASLRLTRDGFHVRSLWRGHFTPWSAITGFRVARIARRSMVAFDFTDPGAHRGAGFARALTGVEGALPDSYGMSVERLAALMNAWREQALAAPGTADDNWRNAPKSC